jgi:hypothetical protein
VFYVVADDPAGRVKFGISWGTGPDRLATHRTAGYRAVIRLVTGLPDGVADAIEQDVKATLRLAGFAPVKGREYFDVDALAVILDVADNYPVPAAAVAARDQAADVA